MARPLACRSNPQHLRPPYRQDLLSRSVVSRMARPLAPRSSSPQHLRPPAQQDLPSHWAVARTAPPSACHSSSQPHLHPPAQQDLPSRWVVARMARLLACRSNPKHLRPHHHPGLPSRSGVARVAPPSAPRSSSPQHLRHPLSPLHRRKIGQLRHLQQLSRRHPSPLYLRPQRSSEHPCLRTWPRHPQCPLVPLSSLR
jgi:hypothetical protein